jgi:hypothetical protein
MKAGSGNPDTNPLDANENEVNQLKVQSEPHKNENIPSSTDFGARTRSTKNLPLVMMSPLTSKAAMIPSDSSRTPESKILMRNYDIVSSSTKHTRLSERTAFSLQFQ